eukprot:TRINITY_DN2420_c0_g1_i1.p1 TRINITY_DN2420_c0_g1~~TRINITY_DN2420_c0_g1_i1.p1  ORF type:complete len:1016 (+),score=87.41 TRINITY_DN2420_c0_g1_i1:1170-4217(+)
MKEEQTVQVSSSRTNSPMRNEKELDTSDSEFLLDEEEQTPLRSVLEKLLISQGYNVYIEFCTAFLSLFSTGFYVASTYLSDGFGWLDSLDIAICTFFLVEYLMVLYISQHRMQLIVSPSSLLDLFIIFSVLVFTRTQKDSLAAKFFVGASRLSRIIKFVGFIPKRFKLGDTEVNRQIMTIVLTLLSIIYISAGIFQLVENEQRSSEAQLPFHHTVYFAVVTIATVGYGDIVPTTEAGKILVVALIIVTFVLVPKQTNDLYNLMNQQSVYVRNAFKPHEEVSHILITGSLEIQPFKFICQELFHPEHGTQDKHIVILQNKAPDLATEMFLRHSDYELFMTYIQGNPFDTKALIRASAGAAAGCIILSEKHPTDPLACDQRNILTALAVKTHVFHAEKKRNIPLLIQLLQPENRVHYLSTLSLHRSTDQLIVIEELKMQMMAQGCINCGFICLINNLISSSHDARSIKSRWSREYIKGMDYEIYRATLSPKFENQVFKDVARAIYTRFNAVAFALEMEVEGKTIIRLAPMKYLLQNIKKNKIHVYVICEEKKIAEQIAVMNMSNEDIAADLAMKKTEEGEQKKPVEWEEDEYWNEFDKTMATQASITREIRYITRNSLEDHPKIRNHIIICGASKNLYHFILPLRAKYLKDVQPIVILSSAEISSQFLKKIGMYPKIYRIVGSPLNPEDLKRANINSAAKVVIVSSDSLSNCKTLPDELLDAEAIFVYKTVKLMNPDIQIILELANPANIKYLELRGRDYEGDFDFSPVFAAGDVYTYSIIDTLTAQAYFNPHIVTIFHQLLRGLDSKSTLVRSAKELKQGKLLQIPVPEEFINKQFRELFLYLLDTYNLLPLGIYRMPGATDNRYPYVYTNPDPECRLSHKDKVFVLGKKKPEVFSKKPCSFAHPTQKETQLKINIQEGDESQRRERRRERRLARIDIAEQLEQRKMETAAGKIAKNIENKVEEIRHNISRLNNEIDTQKDRINEVIDGIFDVAKKDALGGNDSFQHYRVICINKL